MLYQFPNTIGLERAKSDPEEPIYSGSSIGSNKILYNFSKNAGLVGNPRWDLYLINLYTLMRNAYSKGITQKNIEQIIDTDINLYVTFIGAYSSYQRPIQVVILFYAPDYKAIPKELLRTFTGQRLELDNLYTNFKNKIPTKLMELTEDFHVRKFVVATRGGTFPHKELIGHLKSIYGGNRIHGPIGTVLISHCPIDLHMKTMLPEIELLESYTANILTSKQFGNKLTKEIPNLSFNMTTHRIFGDDIHLVPLIHGKQRTKLIEFAIERNWPIRTEKEITNDLLIKFSNISLKDLLLLKL